MRLRRSVLSCLLLTGLSLGALSPARAADDPTPADVAGAGSPDGVTDPLPDPPSAPLSVPASRADAQESLSEVNDLFDPMSHTESRSLIRSGGGRDATLALRDLSLRLGSLSRA